MVVAVLHTQQPSYQHVHHSRKAVKEEKRQRMLSLRILALCVLLTKMAATW
jgi:hypothetical protein